MKTIITTSVILAFSALALGIAGTAQAHHKTGHCIPGILTAGCPVTPQVPNSHGGN